MSLHPGHECAVQVSDVLSLPLKTSPGIPEQSQLGVGVADVVVMEMGILHYFVDLLPLLGHEGVVPTLLRPGGRLVLRDFHPVSTKLVSSRGKKLKADGDYFYSGLTATSVAHSKFGKGGAAEPAAVVQHRRWTMGEILTAAASGGLCLDVLDEEPGVKPSDRTVPKIFTLVAHKL
mmetsp:Transcript_38871/g.74465  ORF Transcript_38871/g.74465 Transcript_38871/m.74465 type:complete len:176 (+) Transcript_38871:1300-1827(+)